MAHEQEAVFEARNIDTRGIERAAGKSFFWEGSYLDNLNEAKTHSTELNVFAAFAPKIPEAYRDSEFLFLANIDPVLATARARGDARCEAGGRRHHELLDQGSSRGAAGSAEGPGYLLINDTEAKMLAGNNNLVQAARAVMALGPRLLVVKHGEYGATLLPRADPRGKGRSALSCAGAAFGRSGGPDRRGRQLCRRLLRLPGLASRELTAAALPPRHVLRQRDGLVRRASASAPSGCSSLPGRRSTTASISFRELTHLD